jgi:Zn-dependent protease with chaperone function
MNEFVALPLVVTLTAAFVAMSMHGRLPAEVAAKMGVVALATLTIAAVPTFWLMGSSGLRHLGVRSPFTDWSEHLLPSFGFAGGVVGAMAFVLMLIGSVRVVHVLRLHRRLRAARRSGVEILPSPELFAYTLPGPAGNIVLSEGLVDSLDERECRAVIAHERSHARHRHDRYLLLGRIATALLPFVKPLAGRLEFSLERWADDEAAAAVGDRRLVATAIARVATAGMHPAPSAAGIARLGAAARAQALLEPAPRLTPWHPFVVVAGLALSATLLSALFQLHHTVIFGASLLG